MLLYSQAKGLTQGGDFMTSEDRRIGNALKKIIPELTAEKRAFFAGFAEGLAEAKSAMKIGQDKSKPDE